MTVALEKSIVRVLDGAGRTAGTGFLVSRDGLIVTCSHVVLPREAQERGEPVPAERQVVLFATQERRAARVDATAWRPVAEGDVAFLRLQGEPPAQAEPLPMGSSLGTQGHPFETFGFPSVNIDGGLSGEGRILGQPLLAGRRVLQLSSPQVTPGFSGAPVVDALAGRAVGMVSSIAPPDRFARQATTAFAVRTEDLRGICAELVVSDTRPYRGLEPFTEDDAGLFFGRENAGERLVARLRENPRFVAVLGPSGSGKSSLVRARLVPALLAGEVASVDPADDDVAIVRPADPAFASLLRRDATPGGPPAWTVGWNAAHPAGERFVLVIDQFEELFHTGTPAFRDECLSVLVQLLESDLRLTVILVLWDAFATRLAKSAPALLGWVEKAREDIPPFLSRAELLEIVERPAAKVGLRFEAGLADRIVGDASVRGEAYAWVTVLPLLEFTLGRLWERRADGVLTHDAYEAIGGVTGALAHWAHDAYQALAPQDRELARRMLLELVQIGDPALEIPKARRRRAVLELAGGTGGDDAPRGVLRALVRSRLLLPATTAGGDEAVEIVHDALLHEWKELGDWIGADWPFLSWRQGTERRAGAFVASRGGLDGPARRDDPLLLRGAELGEAERWLRERRPDLGPEVGLFIEESIEARERDAAARRRLRRLTQVLLVLALVALAFAAWQWRQATRQRDLARSRHLAAQALARMNDRYDLALLLAVEAYRIVPTTEAKGSLLEVLLHRPRLERMLHGHHGEVYAVAWSPDGALLASGAQDARVGLWDAAGGGQRVRWLEGHDHIVRSVAFSPDGRRLASGGHDRKVIVWDVATGKAAGEPLAQPDRVEVVRFHPDGARLAVLLANSQVVLWETVSRRSKTVELGTGLKLNDLAFSPDGRLLAIAHSEGLAVWNLEADAGPVAVGPAAWIAAVAFTPDGKKLAVGQANGEVALRDVGEREPSSTLVPPRRGQGAVRDLAFARGGRPLVSIGPDGISLHPHWDGKGDLGIAFFQPYLHHALDDAGDANEVAVHPDGRLIATAHADSIIRIFDPWISSRVERRLEPQAGAVSSLAFAPKSGLVAVGWAAPKVTRVFEVETGKRLTELIPEESPAGRPPPQGPRIGAPLTNDYDALVWTLEGGSASPTSLAFDLAGERLVVGRLDGAVQLWDGRSGRAMTPPLAAHEHAVRSIAFSPLGDVFASGSLTGTIVVHDAGTGRRRSALRDGHRDSVRGLAFHRDGARLFSGGGDGRVLAWTIDTGTHRVLYKPQARLPAIWLGLREDGDEVVTLDSRGTTTILDGSSGDPVEVRERRELRAAFCLAADPGLRLVAAGHPDGLIRLHDWATNRPIGAALRLAPSSPRATASLGDDRNAITSIALSQDGRWLAAGDRTGRASIWNVDPASWRDRATRVANRDLTDEERAEYLGD